MFKVNCFKKLALVALMSAQSSYVFAADISGAQAVDTPLHNACKLSDLKFVEVLLGVRASVNVRGANGYTPLHYACNTNNARVVDLLIKSKGDVSAQGTDGITPLGIAYSRKNRAILSVIDSHIALEEQKSPAAAVSKSTPKKVQPAQAPKRPAVAKKAPAPAPVPVIRNLDTWATSVKFFALFKAGREKWGSSQARARVEVVLDLDIIDPIDNRPGIIDSIKIVERFGQMGKNAAAAGAAQYAYPEIDEKALAQIRERALWNYRHFVQKYGQDDLEGERTDRDDKPHRADLCELCQMGRRCTDA